MTARRAMMDWGDGHYELTARELESGAERVVTTASLRSGERVLDLGCGTGNAAILAARAGAQVLAMDPAPRLLEVTAERARAEGLELETAEGHGSETERDDNEFDAVVAVFSVIFAPEPDSVAREMLRVTRPGGRIVMASWTPTGAVHASVMALLAHLPGFSVPDSPWGDEAALGERFPGEELIVSRHQLSFHSTSAEDWFDTNVREHPVWRAFHRGILEAGGDWERGRSESVAALAQSNEDSSGFRVTSDYLVAKVLKRDF
ncbi:MAG: class I SAM-dependent methyltransferase [Myxococcota bacterium]